VRYSGALAVDGQHVDWTGLDSGAPPIGGPPSLTGTIGRANLDGSGVEPRFIITGASDPTGVAVDAAHVYWINLFTGTIGRANLDGSGVDQSFIADVGYGTGDLAVNFSLGKLKKANSKGTARLTVEVPASGEITLAQTRKV
jgi:hypothetical protein